MQSMRVLCITGNVCSGLCCQLLVRIQADKTKKMATRRKKCAKISPLRKAHFTRFYYILSILFGDFKALLQKHQFVCGNNFYLNLRAKIYQFTGFPKSFFLTVDDTVLNTISIFEGHFPVMQLKNRPPGPWIHPTK